MWKPNPSIDYTKYYSKYITIYYNSGDNEKNIAKKKTAEGYLNYISKGYNHDDYSVNISKKNTTCRTTIVSNLITHIKFDLSESINSAVNDLCDEKMVLDLSNIVLKFTDTNISL